MSLDLPVRGRCERQQRLEVVQNAFTFMVFVSGGGGLGSKRDLMNCCNQSKTHPTKNVTTKMKRNKTPMAAKIQKARRIGMLC